ncbi:MAG: hypothetical protein EAS52_13450 [Parapedobacter sp.]|nr:MAG: hypothetical protein EAS52_13450 [Parapedobacter sp.]
MQSKITRMKKTIKHTIAASSLLLMLNVLQTNAQVVPTTSGVNLFCQGSDLDLGTPPANTEWIVRYSSTETTTPTTTLVLTDNSIPAADLETGYYYISTVGNAANPEICESDMATVPVYVFAPLTVDFDAEDYCIEDAGDQTFTADLTTTDAYTTYAYQWFTVSGGVETAIVGATSATYTPDPDINPNTTTTYRLKAGYSVGSLTYCSSAEDHEVTVLPKPSTPTITIGGSATGETL